MAKAKRACHPATRSVSPTPSAISRREFLLGVAGTAGALLVQSCGDGTGTAGGLGNGGTPKVVMLEDVPLSAWNPDTSRFHPGVDRLLEILRNAGTPLLRTSAAHPMGGSEGVVRPDDVVVIKVNGVSRFIGSTNTDILGGLVARILDHPDGFEGEVVLIDKFFFHSIPTRGEDANAENPEQNFDFVADALGERVTTRQFNPLFFPLGTSVPYEPEPWVEGYVDLMTLFPDEPAFSCLSYPRFTTERGTRIDFPRGVYEEGEFRDRLRFIDVPVLKNHGWMGMTSGLKNLFGIINIGTWQLYFATDPVVKAEIKARWLESHREIYRSGLFGRIMRHIRQPDLTIVDATRILNQPPFGPDYGDGTPAEAWRTAATLFASSDTVAVDHAAATELMYPTRVITPCGPLTGRPNCQEPPPCLANPGHCERYRPDLDDDRIIPPRGDPSDFMYFEGGYPVNAFAQYLRTAAAEITGRPDAAPDDYTLTRERL